MRRALLLSVAMLGAVVVSAVTGRASAAPPAGLLGRASGWSLVRDNSVGGRPTQLAAMSCLGPNDCLAGGDAGDSVLIEHYDGTSWRAQQGPGVGRLVKGFITGVACTSKGRRAADALELRVVADAAGR